MASYDISYEYDAVGNRTLMTDNLASEVTTYTYGRANQLLSEESSLGTIDYTYDADGNRTQKDDPVAGVTDYTYDQQNRLTKVETPAAGTVSLTYNADDKRVIKATSAGVRKFIYDGEKLLQEAKADDSTEATFDFALQDEYGELTARYHDAAASSDFYMYDGLGSTENLTDEAEADLNTYQYHAFGQLAAETGATDNDFTFIGKYGGFYDLETDLYFFNRRYQDPATGQFTTKDPAEADEENTYRYVGNNPVNGVDPSGLEDQFRSTRAEWDNATPRERGRIWSGMNDAQRDNFAAAIQRDKLRGRNPNATRELAEARDYAREFDEEKQEKRRRNRERAKSVEENLEKYPGFGGDSDMPLPDADSLAEEFLRETQRPDLSIIEKHATEIIDRARAVDARINATEGREVQRIQLGCDQQRRAEARAVFPYKDQPNALNIDALPASEINRLAQLDQLSQLKDLVKRYGPSKKPGIRGSRRFMPVFQTPTGKFAVPAYTVGEGSNQFKFTWDMESQQIYVMKNARVAANSTEIVDETLGLDSSKTSYWEGELVYPTEAQWAEINKLFGRPMQQTFFDYVPTDRNSRFLAKVFLVTYGGGPAGLAAEEALKKGASGMKAFAILSAKALVDVAEGHAFIFFGGALFRLAGKFAGRLLGAAWRYALGPITKVLAKAISRVFGRIFSKTKGKLKELIGEASRKLKDYLKRWGKKADNGAPRNPVSYKRPSGHRKGVRDQAWENAKGPDGLVRDPKTNTVMNKHDAWDMGHKPGYEYRKHAASAKQRGISREQFLNEHNNPNHYRPELPSSNRSHSGEAPDGVYFGP